MIYEHQLYLIAKTHSGEVRFYRFSRLLEAERADDTFDYPSQTEYDPEQLLRDSFGIFIGNKHPITNVCVRFSVKWKAFVRSHRWHPSQQVSMDERGVLLRLRVRTCPELEAWILSFGEDAEVIEPQSLRERIAERARQAASRYA